MNVGQYTESELQTFLTEDVRVAEQGIRVIRVEDGVALTGEVESAQRRDLICTLINERFPDLRLHCDIGVTKMREPDEVEEL
jgi:hypothetical protein